jgi:uncharacterized membrane protein YebE (DUF533 family)
MNALTRWFARTEHDGAAPALEAAATGVPPHLLQPETTPPVDRRRGTFEPTQKAVFQAVGTKVLLGWLQNRHQTLLPLTVNFRVLDENDAELLAEAMAAAMLAMSGATDASREPAEAFLRASGASGSTLELFRQALANPQPLVRLFDRLRASHGLGPLAYILMVVANDGRDPANVLFLQWAAARLELPTTVVRSVERRYRR